MKFGSTCVCFLGFWASVTVFGVDLSGEWTVRGRNLDGRVRLPGTLADAKLGRHMTEEDWRTTKDIPQQGALMREYQYLGEAVYTRKITLSAADCARPAELFLERVMWKSEVSFDGQPLGMRDSLATPHVRAIPADLMTPGGHTISIAVDNSNRYRFSRWAHSYGPAMQSVWHGVLGRMEIREANALRNVRIFATAGERELAVEVPADFVPSEKTVSIRGLKMLGFEKSVSPYWKDHALVKIRLSEIPESWSEFHPHLYSLELLCVKTGFRISHRFGFRTYARQGRTLLVNGVKTFLRGNIDNCNFALTGSPAMTKPEWIRIFRTLRDGDGINSVRFHTWTPPLAAFEAADELGLYLMPEANVWVDKAFDSLPEAPDHVGYGHPIDSFVRSELDRITAAYGNSPSFLSLAIGNELGKTKWDEAAKMIAAKKTDDPRRLYFVCTAREISSADDITVTHKVPKLGMAREVFKPTTDWDYEDIYGRTDLPTVAHEIGQWPVYPMWDFLGKFTGLLRPWNIARHLKTAERNNAVRFNRLYHEASAKTSRLIYKDEVESFLRTPSCAGVELLNIQDFTGQGEALVGWRDPFYDLKPGYAQLPAFNTIWNVTNYLARMEKYDWTEDEAFTARLEIRNLGEKTIAAGTTFAYEIDGRKTSVVVMAPVGAGEVGRVADVKIASAGSLGCGKHVLRFGSNTWSFWVFPQETSASPPLGVTLTADPGIARKKLAEGRTVVFTGQGRRGNRDTFRSVYWTGSKQWDWVPPLACTLGTYVFKDHQALAGFPTEDWADWQWYRLIEGARIYEIADVPESFRPITLSVNDFHFSYFSSSLFEVRVGKGRLIVCGYPIEAAVPAAKRLRASIFDYVASGREMPMPVMDESWFLKMFTPEDIVIENAKMRLVIGGDGRARSLREKKSGEEMLVEEPSGPFFSVTQMRPFNNEIKLHHPNTRTTYRANRVRREGNRLFVGFETAPYEAVVDVTNSDDGYVAFKLVRFDVRRGIDYSEWYTMDLPPAESFRVAQLEVLDRTNFGEWLNVMWDDRAACAVMGLDEFADIHNVARSKMHVLTADLLKGLRLVNGAAAVVVGAGGKDFLDSVDAVERDYNLPRGVQSRRSKKLNASIYWTGEITPENADDEIAIARKGGFTMMLMYFPVFSGNHEWAYGVLGDYMYNKDYPNGQSDVKKLLDRVKAAGITPGYHTLQTHIGIRSSYVTPVADARLNKTRRFTLAKPIGEKGPVDEIFVYENPVDVAMHPKTRVLQFGGELFSYEKHTETPPYRFLGVKRGTYETRAQAHPVGQVGGTLDLSEFGADSCYIDQATDLQDEIAAKIANICDAGMEFMYFDGSEGVNPPCGVNVARAQYRVTSRLKRPPLFTEGAAKSHFGWHLQAGANAFDGFGPEVFKEKILEFPFAEAPEMRKDFTRVDFGWWSLAMPGVQKSGRFSIGTQADMWEFGTSKAAAWDCPATIQIRPWARKHPRLGDILETMRRWEEVRATGYLTEERKALLRDPTKEYHLHPDGKGGHELVEWRQSSVGGRRDGLVRAFLFESGGKRIVAYWHVSGEGDIVLDMPGENRRLTLHAAGMQHLVSDLSADALQKAFSSATIVK